MNKIDNYKAEILNNLDIIAQYTDEIESIYNSFFKIGEIFSSEFGGKTRLNRQIFNENHEEIIKKIAIIESIFDESLEIVRNAIMDLLGEYNEFDKVDITNLIFDDTNFLDLLELDLKTKAITKDKKKDLINDIKSLFLLKNRIFNIKYYIEMFDTSVFDKLLNKLGIEDLINSSVIFEIIDCYGLQFEELEKFRYAIKHFINEEEKVDSFLFLNPILELHRRRIDNFYYANVKYKISLDYNVDLEFNKYMNINKSYLENIVSNLIFQSSMDLVKKELKKGKIQKNIEVNLEKIKGKIVITVKNNGFDIKNVQALFAADIENKYILEVKNLVDMMDGEFDIQSLENEGFIYTVVLKLK